MTAANPPVPCGEATGPGNGHLYGTPQPRTPPATLSEPLGVTMATSCSLLVANRPVGSPGRQGSGGRCPARPSPTRRCLNNGVSGQGPGWGTATPPGFAPLGPFVLLGKESGGGTGSPAPLLRGGK